jgi:hypothetical protein
MGKFLALWEEDDSRLPADPRERGAGYQEALKFLRQEMKKKVIKGWGSFVGTTGGSTIYEGAEAEVANSMQHFIPFYSYNIYPVPSLEQAEEATKALLK